MKILAIIATVVGALLALAVVRIEGFLLTLFRANHEFWYSSQATSASIIMLALGLILRHRARRSLTIGSALFFSLCSAVILLTHLGLPEESNYAARMDIALTNWHIEAFFYGSLAFTAIPALMLLKKWPREETATHSALDPT